jgi:VWFA-related protein
VTLLALALAVLLQQEKPQEEVFRFQVDVRTVYVDVFVTRDGKALTGLTANDFQVLDNDVPQQIDLVDPDIVPLSTILLLDTSGSVSGERLEHLRSAAHAFVQGLQVKDEAALMTFAHLWEMPFDLSSDFDSLHGALDRPAIGGLTGLHDALFAGLKLAEAGLGRPMVLVFTDGLDNASWITELELLDVVRESEAVVHMVGVQSTAEIPIRNTGSGVTLRPGVGERPPDAPACARDLLEKLSAETGGRAWYADTSANLKDVFLEVLAEMETRYLISYQMQEPVQPGWHTLEVKLKNHKADEIRARRGYMVATETK